MIPARKSSGFHWPHYGLKKRAPFGHYILEKACDGDWDALRALLAEHGMPVGGVRDYLRNYVLARDTALRAVACGGIEHQDDVAVLRSIVVSTGHRHNGLGSLLIVKLMSYARRARLRHAVLVVDPTAGTFAAKFGFHESLADVLPSAGHQSIELSARSPSSLIMYRRI